MRSVRSSLIANRNYYQINRNRYKTGTKDAIPYGIWKYKTPLIWHRSYLYFYLSTMQYLQWYKKNLKLLSFITRLLNDAMSNSSIIFLHKFIFESFNNKIVEKRKVIGKWKNMRHETLRTICLEIFIENVIIRDFRDARM